MITNRQNDLNGMFKIIRLFGKTQKRHVWGQLKIKSASLLADEFPKWNGESL